MNQKSVESGVQVVLKRIAGCTKTADNDINQVKASLDEIERYVAVCRVLIELAPPKKTKKKSSTKKRKLDDVTAAIQALPTKE
tara:strand:- start:2085 stop:2333 length:249 start_codon:yes stop_codon:yes gene_type:complete